MTESRSDAAPCPPVSLGVFVKYPEEEKVKTRLAKAVGAPAATAVYRALAMQTLERVREARARLGVAPTLFIDGADEADFRHWLGGDEEMAAQVEGGLGERMDAALRQLLSACAAPACLIGTDCPGLDLEVFAAAVEGLADSDLVLGPSHDGGYYLIGLRQPCSSLFSGIAWSSADVLTATVDRAREKRMRVRMLPLLRDVDTAQDLAACREALPESLRGCADLWEAPQCV